MSRVAVHPRIDAILFDLFGTLVSIDGALLPRERWTEGEAEYARVSTIPALEELLDGLTPRPSRDRFVEALQRVSIAMTAEKKERGHIELSSRERFQRALHALELEGAIDSLAEEMSERHMASLAAAVVCPGDRREILDRLRGDYRVGLVSNFDHASTAHAVLARNGLTELLDTIVISDDVGVRKPGSRIFEIACEAIAVDPSRCLYVGDSYGPDVEGATGAGLHVVWIDNGNESHGPALGKIADVSELPAWLSQL